VRKTTKHVSHDSRSWRRLINPPSAESHPTDHLDNCDVPWTVFAKNDNKYLELLLHLSYPKLMTQIPVTGSSSVTSLFSPFFFQSLSYLACLCFITRMILLAFNRGTFLKLGAYFMVWYVY